MYDADIIHHGSWDFGVLLGIVEGRLHGLKRVHVVDVYSTCRHNNNARNESNEHAQNRYTHLQHPHSNPHSPNANPMYRQQNKPNHYTKKKETSSPPPPHTPFIIIKHTHTPT